MKKIVSILMCVLLLAGVLAGCGADAGTGSAPASSAAPASTTAPAASTNAPEATSAAPEAAALKVALLVPGLLGDKSFFDQSNQAMELVASTLGAETEVVEMGTDQTKWYPTLVDYSEMDYDLIVTISDPVNDALLEVAGLYPDQMYMNIDSSMEYDVPANMYVMVAKMGEMSFLAGLAGALKAEEMGSDTIGFIGGMDIPGINEFLIGYINGAQTVNPDIKVASSYVGSFTDPSKAKENALIMYASACVIYQAAGASGLGVFDAAKEFNANGDERYAIGVDADQADQLKESDPDAANLIITSAIKNIPGYTLAAVEKFAAGELEFGTRNYLGLKEDGVTIAKNSFYEQLLSQDSRDRLEQIEQDVLGGTVTPINTIGMPTDEVEAMRDAVRP